MGVRSPPGPVAGTARIQTRRLTHATAAQSFRADGGPHTTREVRRQLTDRLSVLRSKIWPPWSTQKAPERVGLGRKTWASRSGAGSRSATATTTAHDLISNLRKSNTFSKLQKWLAPQASRGRREGRNDVGRRAFPLAVLSRPSGSNNGGFACWPEESDDVARGVGGREARS